MSEYSSNQRADGRRKIVSPESRAKEFLDSTRLEEYNTRLNNNGKRTLRRFQRDNKQIILTDYGRFQALRNGYAVYEKGKTNSGKGEKRIFKLKDVVGFVDYLVGSWESVYGNYIKLYPADILKAYMAKDKITPRSPFISKKYYKRLGSYGVNFGKRLENMIATQIKSLLDNNFYDFFAAGKFELVLDELFKDPRWTSHIKTGSNSGYPYNVPQDKEWMFNVIAPRTLKLLQKWIKDPKSINWKKILFEMGSRAERGLSQRIIAMAPAIEKPIGAVINMFVDDNIDEIPIEMPRSDGSFDKMAKGFMDITGQYGAKDFDAFDTRLLLDIFIILRDWFRDIGNAFTMLLAFECDLIINCYMLVGENLIYRVASLPSGIGTTQIIGSLIHKIADMLSGIYALFKKVVYQSDDTLGKGDFSEKELLKGFEWIEKFLYMKISPLGKKSLISPTTGLVLQKFIYEGPFGDQDVNVFFAHEQRDFVNRYARERVMNTDDDLALRLGIDLTNPKEKGNLKKIQGCRGLLGNIAALGVNAPTLPKQLFMLYGRRATSYDKVTLEIALQSLAEWKEEDHKLPMDNDWVRGFYEYSLSNYGWEKPSRNISEKAIQEVLTNFGRTLYV